MSRVHTAAGVVAGPCEARANVVTTWTPGTPIAQVEEAIKAAARQAVSDARARHRTGTEVEADRSPVNGASS